MLRLERVGFDFFEVNVNSKLDFRSSQVALIIDANGHKWIIYVNDGSSLWQTSSQKKQQSN